MAKLAPSSPRGLDPLLAPVVANHDAEQHELMIGRLLTDCADPVIRRSLHFRLGSSARDEMEDVRGAVMVRLLRKLDELQHGECEPIASFADYVATVAYHAVDDFLRKKQPQRTLLKNRLRYLLSHDSRFAVWLLDRELVCGRAEWQKATRCGGTPSHEEIEPAQPALSLQRLFAESGGPLPLDVVVTLFATAAGIGDLTAPQEVEPTERSPSAFEQLESKQLLAILWREVQELPVRQRIALLLNLRDAAGQSALPLLPQTGVASLEKIAGLLDMSSEMLTSLWNELPLDDNRIAAILSLTRQQVINLRKSARERLGRRLRR